jgi:hypothetical protein
LKEVFKVIEILILSFILWRMIVIDPVASFYVFMICLAVVFACIVGAICKWVPAKEVTTGWLIASYATGLSLFFAGALFGTVGLVGLFSISSLFYRGLLYVLMLFVLWLIAVLFERSGKGLNNSS